MINGENASFFRQTDVRKEAGKLKRAAKKGLMTALLLCLFAGCLLPPTAEAYDSPGFQDSAWHPDLAQYGDRAGIDTSSLSEGYVAVSATSETRLKFQVIKDEDTYTYDLPADGTPAVFPLQSGSGSYRFRVMENVIEQKYSELWSVTADAVLNAVYDYICSSISYDRDKAASVKSGYLPDPDETLQTGKGICFDYAALAAAMLRSQGIPTKMIFGYVAPKDLYHAWNMFYTDETGWVTVGFEADADTWNRIDLTFASSGADAQFIGDGSNYSDLYFY